VSPGEVLARFLRALGVPGQEIPRSDDERAARYRSLLAGRLPLALRVTAELAASRSGVSLADLTAELADQQQRLDLLDADGDAGTAVRAVFSWSYRHLDAATARCFRLLGRHPGPDWEPYAVAALAGVPLRQGRGLLDRLASAHLVQPAGPGRLAMHDLLRAYAAELADRHDSKSQQRAALTRLLDHYLHTAAAATQALFPADQCHYPDLPAPASRQAPVPPVAEPGAASGPGSRSSTAPVARRGSPATAARMPPR
jgi:hypothetical protein